MSRGRREGGRGKREAVANQEFPWRAKLALLLGRGALRALGLTWRIRVVNAEPMIALCAAKQGFIFSLWHGQLLPLLWHHRGQGIVVLISEHRDGEIVARAASSLGFGLIRGSSTRGADRALISISRELKTGKAVAITPDGPKGPSQKFAPGALVAAQRSGSFIVTVGVSTDRAWRLHSWDQFMIPKPFARVTIAYGAPTKVSASSPRMAAEEAPRFEQLMSDTIRMAGA
ncbi:MAG TPA: lysophospholipid acyltransferase family protein [Gemmatimonadaceae bacterium]|nr:lysophospholipid acyltransferase family protein [Gemmatimonadaceae bacterium]